MKCIWAPSPLEARGARRWRNCPSCSGSASPRSSSYQGQEFAASSPFLYFADHQPDLRRRVRQGRVDFLRQFRSLATEEAAAYLGDPGDPAGFERCKLDLTEREKHARVYQLHHDLLRLRREDPTLASPKRIEGATLAAETFVLRYVSDTAGDDRLLLVNLGRDQLFDPAPEPLLAPPPAHRWTILWSSEWPRYGGGAAGEAETKSGWALPARTALLLHPIAGAEPPDLNPHAST